MMKFLRLALVLVPVLCGPAFAEERIAEPSRWIGQVDEHGGRFGWPGSGFALAFEGTRVSATLSDGGENSVMVEVDGEATRLDLETGEQSYVLAEGLAQGPHIVRVQKRTEGQFGAVAFGGAETDGTFVSAPPPDRTILVVGDSISAGYGIEGADETCGFSADTENQYLTFAALAGRTFGSEVTTLAISGKGAIQNYDGGSTNPMPVVMDRAIPMEQGAASPREPADVVVVHLGTNDFGSGAYPEGFEEAYANLLTRLRAENPEAIIYAAIGPTGSFDTAQAAITAVVARLNGEGDDRVAFLPLQIRATSFGCNWHPSAETHRWMAEQLIAAIGRDLEWTAR